MFRLTLTVEGEVVIDRVLGGIDERARNLLPAWARAVEVFRDIVRRAFVSEGATTGAPWPQLAARTQDDRRRQGFPPAHPILQRTGALFRAFAIGTGAYAATTSTTLRYLLSSELAYFQFHQSNRPRTRLPRRAPVLFTADDRTALVHPIRLWITGRDPHAPRREAVT
jgi:hypothetical protein